MKKILYIILLSLPCALTVSAQKVMLEEKPFEASESGFGPNQKNFTHFTVSVGTLFGTGNANMPVNTWRSTEFSMGYRYKRKLSGMFSIGGDLLYHYAAYNINQVDHKPVTDSLIWGVKGPLKHDVERFSTDALRLNAYIRINFDPHRGDYMGHYLDLGYGADWNLGRNYTSIDKKSDGSKVNTSITGLPYINPIGLNGYVKLGTNFFAVYVNYRVSSLFQQKYNLPEPPVFSAGIELNPHPH